MSKQRNDQQPQSASASDKKTTADGESRTEVPEKTASSTSHDGSPSANPAAKTDPVKPDVAPPASEGEPLPSQPVRAGDKPTRKAAGQQDKAASVGTTPASQSTPAEPKKAKGSTGSTDKAAAGTPSAGTASADKAKTASGDKSAKGDKPRGPLGRGDSGSTTPPSPPKGGGNGNGGRVGKLGLLALILVVVLAIVIALAGYRGWQKLQQQQAQLSQIQSNSSAIGDIESRLGDLDQSRQQTLNMMRGEFDQYRQNLDGTLDKVLAELAQQQQADPREWLHAEAEYLLRLANQRLQLERDVNGAKALLNAADGRLREADNPALVPIRRAIQSELAALDSVPVIDRTGIYLALMAQQEQLARLPLKQDIEEIAASKGDATPSGGWREQLATLGSELKDLVTVRRHDQPLEALITPEQESYLRQNVRLLLEQAQLALLKAEPKLYQASLDKARELVEGYYATDNDGVTRSLERLEALRDENVRPELPDISESSQLLKRFIEQRFGNGGNAGNESSQGAGE